MKRITSKDKTTIAFDVNGRGSAIILVTGGLGFRSDTNMVQLAERLAPHLTVFNYDRRGRGDSGDTLPYTVEREIEDIESLIDEAGGVAYLFGLSSGAILALEAANKLSAKVAKLALYEPPFILDDSRPPLPVDYVEQINAAIAAGRRGDAVEIFMTRALLIPADFVAYMRNSPLSEVNEGSVKPPDWADMEKLAHTLAYDGTIIKDYTRGEPLPARQWPAITFPTLVVVGENCEPYFHNHNGAQTLVNDLPYAKRHILVGQDHAVAPAALAPVLIEFYTG
jgi:pimeloyl-ACP methyl ester carboxylesterase